MRDPRSLAKTRVPDANVRPTPASPQPADRVRNTRKEADSRTRNVASGCSSVAAAESAEPAPALADTAEFLVEATEAETKLLKVRVHNLKAWRFS